MRYFFHVDDHLPNNDVDGTEIDTLKQVEHETCRLVGRLMADGCTRFWRNPDWRVRVTDESGALVLTIAIKGARGPEAAPLLLHSGVGQS